MPAMVSPGLPAKSRSSWYGFNLKCLFAIEWIKYFDWM
jgi:hypothetical protein